MNCMRPVFPFSAIVGQEEMKLALLLVAIDPTIGGVMVFGDRGTGKSTAVRALAGLLPAMKVVSGCRYGCDPNANGARCDECRAKAMRGETMKSVTAAGRWRKLRSWAVNSASWAGLGRWLRCRR